MVLFAALPCPRSVPVGKDWVELCITNSEHEAYIIIGLLKSYDIPSRIKSYRVSQFPLDVGHIGEIKILVLASDIEDAKEIIRDSEKNINSANDLT